MDDLYVLHGYAQFIGHYLSEGRLLPLTVRGGSDKNVDLASSMEPDDCALPHSARKAHRPGHLGGTQSANLTITGHANTDIIAMLPQMLLLMA